MSKDPEAQIIEDKFKAAIEMLGRTGSDEFQIRYCEEEEPTIWMAAAHWPYQEGLVPEHWDAAGGMTPWSALLRLMEATMDGGTCTHCHRPTSVDDKPTDAILGATEAFICWYRFDPELKTFRRSCEGIAE